MLLDTSRSRRSGPDLSGCGGRGLSALLSGAMISLRIPHRYYHAARLRWNSIERLRGPLEDLLIDDLVDWSLWNYASIRSCVDDPLFPFNNG